MRLVSNRKARQAVAQHERFLKEGLVPAVNGLDARLQAVEKMVHRDTFWGRLTWLVLGR